jgi:hypothetical protein
MRRLSKAKLREMAATRELEVDEDDLTRLLPMVRDLIDVARRLRAAVDERPSRQSG